MQNKSVEKSRRRQISKDGSKAVLQKANGYIIQHYPFGCLGKDPQRLVGSNDFWIVSVYLTSPGFGAVGQVGLVAVAARTMEVVAATQRQEVNRAIKRLKEKHRDELEAAFHRARTT